MRARVTTIPTAIPLHLIMNRALFFIVVMAALSLLSSCGIPIHSFNLAECLDPPDKRVALINGDYPARWNTGFTPTATWVKDGTTYHEVTVQYAQAHRPLLRAADHDFHAPALSPEETQRYFTIDTTIPAQRILLSKKGEVIPSFEFDFRNATKQKTPSGRIRIPRNIHLNCKLDTPGTSSAWRSIVQAPLLATDGILNIATNGGKYMLIFGAAVVSAPIVIPIQELCRQNQRKKEHQQ